MLKIVLTTTLFLSVLHMCSAQFTLSAEVRPRTELRRGFKTLHAQGDDPALFTEQRSRIYLDHKADAFSFRLSLQDIRIWGENSQIFKDEQRANTFLNEAWGQYNFSDVLSVRVGRQMLSYNDQRFLGGLEWAQQGRRHDAVLFKYEPADFHIHVGLAYNQDDDIPEPLFIQRPGASYYSVNGNYKTMQFVHIQKDFEEGSVSGVFLNDGRQQLDSTIDYRRTAGLIGDLALGKLSLFGDVYYQFGELNNKSINALLLGFDLVYKTSFTPLNIGFEYISGEDDESFTTNRTAFDPTFGTNHAHNGFMDYFFVGPANGTVGVTDLYFKTKYDVLDGKLMANIHQFWTGSRKIIGTEEISGLMGHELDLVFTKKLRGAVQWHLGFSTMLPTNTMESLRGKRADGLQYWGWTMLTFKPVLFSTAEKKD